MINLREIKIEQIRKYFKKAPRILGEHAFLAVLGFIFLALLAGSFIFYKYVVLVEKREPVAIERVIQFNNATYQGIIQEWERRQAVLETTGAKEYPDLFNTVTEPIPEENSTTSQEEEG